MLRNLPVPFLVVLFMLAILWSAFTRPSEAGVTLQEATTPVATPTATEEVVEEVVAPTSTPLPVELTVEFVTDYPLDRYPAQAGFSLRFNQPMDMTSSALPIQVEPYPDSSLSWNRSHTVLRFSPLTSLEAGATYTITVDNGLKSANGQSLEQPASWTIRVVDGPHLVERAPADYEIDNRRPMIRLTFDRPMNQASVADGLTVEPAVPLLFTWLENNLLIQPAEPLATDETYRFYLSSAVMDTAGMALGEEVAWRYELPQVIERVSWPAAGEIAGVINIRLNYAVAAKDLRLDLQPPTANHLVAQSDPMLLSFVLDEPLRGDVTYRAQLAGQLLDENGDELVVAGLGAHQTPSLIGSFQPGPGQSVNPATVVAINFGQAMDEAATAAALTITPEVAGEIVWADNRMEFRPAGGRFAAETIYRVTLSAAARMAEGYAIMSDSRTWTFETSELRARVSFGEGLHSQTLDSNGRRAVQFSYAPEQAVGDVHFELYQLSLEQWLDNGGTSGGDWLNGWDEAATERTDTYVHIQETHLPADLRPGIYRLELSLGGIPEDELIVFLSSYSLLLKRDSEQVLAWVTRLDGQVAGDAELLFYDGNGNLVNSGRTDASGLYVLPAAGDEVDLYKVVARVGEELTYSGTNYGWQTETIHGTEAATQVHIIADRPVYHPGETVYFRAIIRQDDDANLTVLPAGTPVVVRLMDNNWQTVETLELSSSDFGTIHGEFHLAETAETGNYQITVAAAGGSRALSVPVWPLTGTAYQLNVTTDAPIYAEGDRVAVTVALSDNSGQPVANSSVSLELYQSGSDGGCGGVPSDLVWYGGGSARNLSGRTDENGRLTINLTAEVGYNGHWGGPAGSTMWHSPWLVRAAASVDGNQTQAMVVYEVANTTEAVGLEIGSGIKTAGEAFLVTANVVDLADQAVANRRLSLTLFGYNSNSGNYDLAVQTGSLTTGSDGRGTLAFTILNAGRYELQVTGWDGAGREYHTSQMVYAYDPAYTGSYGPAQAFMVTADRTHYAPGDTARLAIHSAFSGPALLTFTRGKLDRYQVVELSAPLTIVEVPVAVGDAPNLHVSVYAWQPQTAEFNTNDYFSYMSQQDGRLMLATTPLKVVDPAKQLTVTIVPAEVGAFRETPVQATFTVRVTNGRGEPVSAEVSLVLADAAAYEFSGPGDSRGQAMANSFYFARYNEVRSYSSMAPTRVLTWEGGFGGCGCGGYYEEGLEFSSGAAAGTVWLPSLVTDANGEATVTVTLPNAASWLVLAQAVTADTQVGEGQLAVGSGQ